MDELTTRHTAIFWASCASVPVGLFVRTAIRQSGDTPLLIVAVLLTMYAGFFAMLFFPTFYEAKHNCGRATRGFRITIGAMFSAHVIAIGGGFLTRSNGFLLAYLVFATGSLLVLRYTAACGRFDATTDSDA